MRELIATIAILLAGIGLAAAQTEFDWTTNPPESGTVRGETVEVDGPGTFRLLTIDQPDVGGEWYQIFGEVAYTGVEGDAYLEMWSHFEGGEAFFSRTLTESGPVRVITGDSARRRFELPFQLNELRQPIRLEINLVMPGPGRVSVGPITLTSEEVEAAKAWWSPHQGNVAGATIGVLFGLSGALVGILAGRGKAPRTVRAVLWAGLGIGVVALVVAGAGFVAGQARPVWYPLVPVGLVGTLVYGPLLPTIRRAQAAQELRRMKALDSG